MAGNSLSPLLLDYRERSADYRRQVGHYAKLLKPVLAVLVVAVGWVLFADPLRRPLWVLAAAVGVANAGLLLMPFVYRSSQLMLTYLLRIEGALDELCLSSGAAQPIHHVDGLPEPSVVVGYYSWKLRCRATPSAKAWRWLIVPLLVATFGSLEVALVLLSLGDPFFENPWRRWSALVVFVGCPAILGASSYVWVRYRVKRDRRSAMERPVFSPDSKAIGVPELQEIVFADFQERNADFRFLADYYKEVIVYVLAAFLALVGAWVHEQQMGFLFLLFPPTLLMCVFVGVFVYRLIKRLKRYLAKVELLLEQWMESARYPYLHSVRAKGVTSRFRIGFFRLIRARHFQHTEGLSPSLYLVPIVGVITLVVLGLVVVCLSKGEEWLRSAGIDSPLVIGGCWLLVLALVCLNFSLYVSSVGIGRDPNVSRSRRTMYQQIVSHCSKLSFSQVLAFALIFAAGAELLTVWGRFGLGVQSTRDTGLLGLLTFGIRIHHGYIGLLLIVIAWGVIPNLGIRNALLMIGIGLVASDLVHHFLVLWPITGSPEFDLLYPKPGAS